MAEQHCDAEARQKAARNNPSRRWPDFDPLHDPEPTGGPEQTLWKARAALIRAELQAEEACQTAEARAADAKEKAKRDLADARRQAKARVVAARRRAANAEATLERKLFASHRKGFATLLHLATGYGGIDKLIEDLQTLQDG